MARPSELLPDPLSPTRAKVVPGFTSKDDVEDGIDEPVPYARQPRLDRPHDLVTHVQFA